MNVDSLGASIKAKIQAIAQNEGRVALATLKEYCGAHKVAIASAYRAVVARDERAVHRDLESNVGLLFVDEGKVKNIFKEKSF